MSVVNSIRPDAKQQGYANIKASLPPTYNIRSAETLFLSVKKERDVFTDLCVTSSDCR